MIDLSQVKFPPEADFSEEALRAAAARLLQVPASAVLSCRLTRKSVDARKKDDVHYACTLRVTLAGEEAAALRRCPWPHAQAAEAFFTQAPAAAARAGRPRPVVVGGGPAGLFAALTLAKAGLAPLLVERGKPAQERSRDVASFWAGGPLDPESNVQFGEGGAGTFSDGKLTTGTKDPRIQAVLLALHEAGAPEEILYQAKPHIGTDRLLNVVQGLRLAIAALGGEVRFRCRLSDLTIAGGALRAAVLCGPDGPEDVACDALILATGHSARDTFAMLQRRGVALEAKAFSVGARIEHPQSAVDRAQYGAFAGRFPPADYKLSAQLPGGRGAYTFCMCPGGVVVAAASEAGGIATNGMSSFARDGRNANSALLVGVSPADFGGDALAGIAFQRGIEQAAYRMTGGYRAPAQHVADFLRGVPTSRLGDVRPSYLPGVTPGDIAGCLPSFVVEGMRLAIAEMDRRLRGFARPDAVLTAPETRSSSPVRVPRGENLQSVSVRGLYPCGEGAGYAGGIMSAAVDGMRCAEAVCAGG